MNGKLRIADYVADSAMMVPKNVISEDAEAINIFFIADDIQGKMVIAKKQFITLGVFEGIITRC